jgi:hypothetical protein
MQAQQGLGVRGDLGPLRDDGRRSRWGAHAWTVWGPRACTPRNRLQLLARRSRDRIEPADNLQWI